MVNKQIYVFEGMEKKIRHGMSQFNHKPTLNIKIEHEL